MKFLANIQEARFGALFSFITGGMLLVISGTLMYSHASTLQEVRDVSVPLAAELPQLERTEAILEDQSELAELESASEVGSLEERVRMYIFPAETDLERVVATFEVIRDVLRANQEVDKMTALTFGDISTGTGSISVQPLTIAFTASKEGLQKIFTLMRLAGIETVGGALRPEELAVLIEQTEAENPAGIVALEQFLSTDLLSYTQNNRVAEDRLLRSFSSTSFIQTMQNITHTSLLSEATRVLEGDLGRQFDTQNLWPMQLMTIEKVGIVPGGAQGWYTLTLGLHLHTRES